MPSIPAPAYDPPAPAGSPSDSIVLAGGCFWCVEAVLAPLRGVRSVRSGYAGGTAATANYQAVCGGDTDHAEVVDVEYDPATISLGQLLQVFFGVAHDPTQVDRQGHDRGRQYRSAIFYRTAEQQAVAEAYIRQLNEAHVFQGPIATKVEPLETFYEAEGYHQKYVARNPGQPYVVFTALPKVEKLKESFGPLLESPEKVR